MSDEEPANIDEIVEPAPAEEPAFICEFCATGFDSKGEFKAHQNACAKNPKNIKKDKPAATKTAVVATPKPAPKAKAEPKPDIECPHCGVVFQSDVDRDAHAWNCKRNPDFIARQKERLHPGR